MPKDSLVWKGIKSQNSPGFQGINGMGHPKTPFWEFWIGKKSHFSSLSMGIPRELCHKIPQKIQIPGGSRGKKIPTLDAKALKKEL